MVSTPAFGKVNFAKFDHSKHKQEFGELHSGGTMNILWSSEHRYYCLTVFIYYGVFQTDRGHPLCPPGLGLGTLPSSQFDLGSTV